MHYNIETIDNCIEMLKYMQLDLLKEVLESEGDDYGLNVNDVEYKNFLVEDPIEFTEVDYSYEYSDFGGDGSTTTYNVSVNMKENAAVVMNALMSRLGLTREQAAGVAGVLAAESGINPHVWNKGEKNGTYKSSSANNRGTAYGTKTSPWSYGAGLCQWTFCDMKEKVLMGGLGMTRQQAQKLIMGAGIESLGIEDQSKMLAYYLSSVCKPAYEGIKKCSSPAQAAATFYCHAVAGYSSSTNPATQAEINKMNARYGHVGANNQINKGMSYAQSLASQ